MSEIHVIAIITPAPGKFDNVKNELAELAANVQKHEPEVSRYHMFEQVQDGENGVRVFVVQETYRNQAVFDAHSKTDYFTKLGKKIGEENLLAAPLDIKIIKPFAGFASR